MLESWLRERHGLPEDPVFPSMRGGKLSRDVAAGLNGSRFHRFEWEPPCLETVLAAPRLLLE